MKRELVKCLRTVTLLAMFSSDGTTVANVQSCLKSMTIMEPDLILHPILERAVPALEALVEVTAMSNFDANYEMLTYAVDSAHNGCHPSLGIRRTGTGLSRGLLSWREAPRASFATPDTRD